MSDKLAADGRELSARYKVWLCDVWGVVHDGQKAFASSCDALARHRKAGGLVVLITNAPRPSSEVFLQLDGLGVPRAAYDDVVTSGDVTRELVSAHKGGKVFFMGPERDLALKAGLPVIWSDLDEAQAVLCTGLYDDRTETPEDYADMLAQIKKLDLPMICANPDIVVRFGERLLPCAGALARDYEALGGKVAMAGKPFAPIYDVCLQRLEKLTGDTVDKDQLVAIGDGLATDIKGARDYGLPVAFVVDGIHEKEIGDAGNTEDIADIARKAVKGVKVVAAMRKLEWDRHGYRTGLLH